MNREHFIVKATRGHEDPVVVWLSPTADKNFFYWSRDREDATRFPSERAAYLSALLHIGVSMAYVLFETIRVASVTETISEKVLEA